MCLRKAGVLWVQEGPAYLQGWGMWRPPQSHSLLPCPMLTPQDSRPPCCIPLCAHARTWMSGCRHACACLCALCGGGGSHDSIMPCLASDLRPTRPPAGSCRRGLCAPAPTAILRALRHEHVNPRTGLPGPRGADRRACEVQAHCPRPHGWPHPMSACCFSPQLQQREQTECSGTSAT